MELQARIHEEDGSFWAEVPELPGCFASGSTIAELVEAVQEAIRLYLEADHRPTGSTHVASIGVHVADRELEPA